MQRFVQRRNVNLLAVFADSVRRQIRENQNFQQNIKLLGDAGAKIAESDAMKNAKGAVTTTSKVTSAVVGAVGTAVEKTFQSPVVQVTGKAIVESAKVISHVSQKVAFLMLGC
jgi:import inner membrane translocase subunit TIM44